MIGFQNVFVKYTLPDNWTSHLTARQDGLHQALVALKAQHAFAQGDVDFALYDFDGVCTHRQLW